MELAEVAELVDAHDSKSCGLFHEGSIPSFGTNIFCEKKEDEKSFSFFKFILKYRNLNISYGFLCSLESSNEYNLNNTQIFFNKTT